MIPILKVYGISFSKLIERLIISALSTAVVPEPQSGRQSEKQAPNKRAAYSLSGTEYKNHHTIEVLG